MIDEKAVNSFINKWIYRGHEDEDDRSYWIDLLQNVFQLTNVTDRLQFQKKVVGSDGNTKRIDLYIPETNTLIEQKSFGIQLDKPQYGHNGMTPYEQAKMYDNALPKSEKSKWIVLSNFAEIWVYDMDTRKPEDSIVKISLSDLDRNYKKLSFLFDSSVERVHKEFEISQKAGDQIGRIYDALIKQYTSEPTEEDLRNLNTFCVRLVFCYYAEDAGLFESDAFKNYMLSFNTSHLRKGLISLFEVLNTPESDRDPFETELNVFPYVNGGLFADNRIIIPQIDDEIKNILISACEFDWADISPTIFGSIFESTLNQDTRRSGGMHYTSIENIHRVIDPLFLDELKQEFKSVKALKQPNVRNNKLREFREKIASLNFFDPACGSGNFLTETYISLRKIENEIIEILNDNPENQMGILQANVSSDVSGIKVSINNFYGIEINDFAVSVAKTAMWIAESQMMKETLKIASVGDYFLPLKNKVNIIEGNALRTDWKDVINPYDCSYIMGNPPFVGQSVRKKEQSEDMTLIWGKGAIETKLDYVICWYKKTVDFLKGVEKLVKTAFVSTNSICQGECVPAMWKFMIDQGIEIQFAYQTFIWDSEANIKAHVHCVIVGFSNYKIDDKKALYVNGEKIITTHINPYLLNAPDIWLENRTNTPPDGMSKMTTGSPPTDDGALTISVDEKNDLLRKYPQLHEVIRPFIGAREFLHDSVGNYSRYCFWFKNANISAYRNIPEIRERLDRVVRLRLSSNADRINKMADYPYLFCQIRQPEGNYLVFPRHSSERRKYIPIGFVQPEVIAGDACSIIPNASLIQFAVLTSNVHNAWMRVVCGRLKSDFRYSPSVYNNFPWPTITDEQRIKIEETASAILEARALYSNNSLADLYDTLTMPPELVKAHKDNDKAVMKAYGFNPNMSESDIVVELMKLYQNLKE